MTIEIDKLFFSEPNLSANGFRTANVDDEQHQAWRRELFVDRQNEINIALTFLQGVQTIKTPRCSSYYLKHVAERWMGSYICNGAMIAALIVSGVPIGRDPRSPNCRYGISKRWIAQREMWKQAKR